MLKSYWLIVYLLTTSISANADIVRIFGDNNSAVLVEANTDSAKVNDNNVVVAKFKLTYRFGYSVSSNLYLAAVSKIHCLEKEGNFNQLEVDKNNNPIGKTVSTHWDSNKLDSALGAMVISLCGVFDINLKDF